MKLTYEDKVKIYHLRKSGCSWSEIIDTFGVDKSGLKYMYRLIEKYGLDSVRKTNKHYYSPELKQEMIDQVLLSGGGGTKKAERIPSKGRSKAQTTTEIIRGFVSKFPLSLLLVILKFPRSTYYYQIKCLSKEDKDSELKEVIQSIFREHKGRYGYRRMTLEWRNQGYEINHKKVQRLMKELGLRARIRVKRRYNSYKGEVGKKVGNLIKRPFKVSNPLEKCYTDVTEFSIPTSDQKLYLSPVLDGYNSEIIAYNLSTSANLQQLKTMLEEAFPKETYQGTILHSDQGWQYQHASYYQFLEEHGISPSMSRKGNSLDNGMLESFFGTLKSEMFYGFEKEFRSLTDLEAAITEYIDYYNNKRIKLKLKGLSPVQYRIQSFA